MKNTVNISNNLNVIPNTYKCNFLNSYWETSMLFDSFDDVIQDESERQRANEKVHSFRNSKWQLNTPFWSSNHPQQTCSIYPQISLQ